MLLLAGVGFFGSSFGMVIAHGRAFFPPHLIGRGVTLLNLFGIAAVGLLGTRVVMRTRLYGQMVRTRALAPVVTSDA